VEEFFLHLWDDLDDIAGVCRHLAAATAAEFAAAAPLIAAASGALLAGTTVLLAHRQILRIFA